MPPAFQALPVLAGVSLCAAFAGGCDVNIHDGRASVHVFSAEATTEWTHHHPLAPNGLVEIVNLNGPIQITAASSASVDVHAVITAKAMTQAGAQDLLSKGAVQETIEPGRVHVETMPPKGFPGSYVVSYEIRVPAGAQTSVSNTNGIISVRGLWGKLKLTGVNGRTEIADIAGPVDAVVANGSLAATYTRVIDSIRLEVTNGSLEFELPAAAQATLSARVVNGNLTVTGLPVEEPSGRRIRNVDAMLNGGGPEVSLRAANGRIRITGK